MPLKKPFTRPLAFQSFPAEIDFLIQPPSPPSHSSAGSFLQPDYMEVLLLGSGVGFFLLPCPLRSSDSSAANRCHLLLA